MSSYKTCTSCLHFTSQTRGNVWGCFGVPAREINLRIVLVSATSHCRTAWDQPVCVSRGDRAGCTCPQTLEEATDTQACPAARWCFVAGTPGWKSFSHCVLSSLATLSVLWTCGSTARAHVCGHWSVLPLEHGMSATSTTTGGSLARAVHRVSISFSCGKK